MNKYRKFLRPSKTRDAAARVAMQEAHELALNRKFFSTRQVPLTDHSELWEIITPSGERVASAVGIIALSTLNDELNDVLEAAAKRDTDVVVNVC